MWPSRSHILAPLTDLLGTTKFVWEAQQQQAFDDMKKIVVRETMLIYPDPNKEFYIEPDASDYQLGGVIKQYNEKFKKQLPIAYYSRKLNSAQKNYTTIEKELLSIVEIFKEYRSILLGAKITVFTDHKNLSHALSQFTTQRVLRWRLILEEFNVTFIHLPGKDNILGDALSRVPRGEVLLPKVMQAPYEKKMKTIRMKYKRVKSRT